MPGLAPEIAKADVVVLATDNEPSRYTINEICVRNGIPFVVGRVFTRGIGGEVFAYRPPDGACLACLEAALQRTPFRAGHPRDRSGLRGGARKGLRHGDRRDQGFPWPRRRYHLHHLVPHPLCPRCHRAAVARAAQISSTPSTKTTSIWGNRPVHPFNKHFHLQRTELSPQEQCAVCATRSIAHAV